MKFNIGKLKSGSYQIKTSNSKFKSPQVIIIIIGFLIIGLLSILAYFYDGFASVFSIGEYFGEDAMIMEIPIWEGLLFCVLCATIGTLIPIGTPYVLPIMIFQYNWYWYLPYPTNIIWVCVNMIMCIIIVSICDLSTYWLGRGVNKLSEHKTNFESSKFGLYVKEHPKSLPYLIILMNFLPISDAMLFLPLGMVKYSFWKIQLWDTLGEALMYIMITLIAIFGFSQFGYLLESESWVLSIVILIVAWIIVSISLYKSIKK
jgi:membrane protein DedA with SNARE-associated domain